jgi:hypothetical protein
MARIHRHGSNAADPNSNHGPFQFATPYAQLAYPGSGGASSY